MRIVRLRMRKGPAMLLAALSKEFAVDVGFAEDLFALLRLKGDGLPTKGRIAKMAELVAKKNKVDALGLNLIMSKRKMILTELVKTPYFKALSHQTADQVLGVQRLLTTFRSFYLKVRQAQCVTCNLKATCDFGLQYGAVMGDITRVIDPDFEKKVHDDCPFLPEITTINQVNQAVLHMKTMMAQNMQAFNAAAQAPGGAKMQQMLSIAAKGMGDPDEDEDDSGENCDPDDIGDNYNPVRMGVGAGTGGNPYRNPHTGAHICQVVEKFVSEVTNAQLAIFELGHKFSLALGKKKEKSYKPVPQVERTSKPEKITSERDLSKIASSQYGLPEEVFEAKLQKRELVKNEFQKQEDRKKLLYLLVDSSGSMGEQMGPGARNNLFTRGTLASVFSLAVVRKVLDDGGIAYLRFFESSPGVLYRAEKKEEFDTVCNAIRLNNYSGGGTDIPGALDVAIQDIHKADKASPLASAEVLMITDCEQKVDANDIKKKMLGYEFNVLDVAGKNVAPNEDLRKSATKYFKGSEQAPDVNKMVELI